MPEEIKTIETVNPVVSGVGDNANPDKGSGDPNKDAVDPLAIGRKFKKIGDFVVDAAYDPTLTPQFKDLNNKFLAIQQKADVERVELTSKLDALTGKLTEKKDLESEDRQKLEKTIADMKTSIALAQKDATAAQVDLLKVQTASALGLPHHFISYVNGETPEAIKESVEKVLTDFNLQKSKFSQEDLDTASAAAANKAKAETEAALKARGQNTEGAGGGDEHVYTRGEVRAMSLADYKANRNKIADQESKGLIH